VKEEHPASIPIRPRRIRRTAALRRLFSETSVGPAHCIAPLFVQEGTRSTSISSLPGHFRFSISDLRREAARLARRGIGGIALFPCLAQNLRTANASAAYNPKGLIPRTLRALKKDLPDFPVFADVALDPYTSHGHDGVLTPDGPDVDNDATVVILARMAVLHGEAGVDCGAPSDRMGRERTLLTISGSAIAP
jgi:porphobilinogen synthase